jgi:hypothetical protein
MDIKGEQTGKLLVGQPPVLGDAMVLFILLQAFDSFSTWLGFRVGSGESSAFIRQLMPALGGVGAVALTKAAALLLMLRIQHNERVVRAVNYWYGVIVVWNLAVVWSTAWRLAH